MGKKIVQPHFGTKSITEITPKDVLDVLQKYETQGYKYTPVRIRTNVGQVFRYAIQTARATNDPTSALRGALAIIPAVHQPTDPQVAWHLAKFIEWVRSIPADAIIVRQNWLSAYKFATDRGVQALNEYARADDPFSKVGRCQISVDVSSVIRASPTSFRVAGTERHYQDGALSETSRWTAILTVIMQPPHDTEQLRANPLGIYVNAINWSKELGQ